MKQVSTFLLLLFCFQAFGAPGMKRASDDDLTYLLAQQRKSQVNHVEYFLHFTLDKNLPGYKGQAKIELKLSRTDIPLSFDFLMKKIESIKVNGEVLKTYVSRKGSFDLPVKVLKPEMTVEITYQGEYSKEASGFQRVKDPEDGSEYVYTDFEPYHSHKLFPGFDQPDLKAIYHVTVSAPRDWKVIQNEIIESEKTEGERTTTIFKATKPISSYLFFLGAGPFVEWKDQYENVPLTLYARKSLEKYVDAKEIFATTKKGLKFFNEFFDYPYPFSKYGQIFIPEFAWGGMENPGAVTLNERNIYRGAVPQAKREDRDNLILHEMAHMWFGDLVTMEWWNDLWLNESFASYVSSIAQARGLESKFTWLDFFHTKVWGYWQDQLVTTHPIETLVPDVRTAKGNFDGITYAKGASSLKQLHFFVGEKGFRDGLRSYFKKYAWKNTKREDFIGAIAEASKVDLSVWTQKWLQTAGTNKVSVSFECKEGEISKATLNQRPSISQTLSPHRTRLALFEIDGGVMEIEKTIDVTFDSETMDLSQLKGEDCPDFILPNYEDQDYALYSLDPKSLSHAKIALTTLPDSLSRMMVWNILAQMTRDQELDPLTYTKFMMEGLKVENDDLFLGLALGKHSNLRDQYLLYLKKVERNSVAAEMETILWNRIMKSEAGSSLQLTFFDFFISVAQTPESLAKIYEMLTHNTPPKGIVLDQDRRWSLLVTLSAQNFEQAPKLIADEKLKDKSTLGKRMGLVAEAAQPSLKSRTKLWKEFLVPHKFTHSDLSEVGRVIHGANFPEASSPFVQNFFQSASRLDWNANDDLVDIYFEKLFPMQLCSPEILKLSEASMKRTKKLSSLAKRGWVEAQDELSRCVKVRAHAKSTANSKLP